MRSPIRGLRKTCAFVLLLVAGMALQAQSSGELRSLFWKQLGSTCQPGLKWEKSVTEIAEDGTPSPETKVFDLDCYQGFATSGDLKVPLNPEEFGHLFEFTFDNPSYSDLLQVTYDGKSVEANVKPDAKDDCKLQQQRFLVDATTGLLRSAHAHILKDSPLYTLEVDITVEFDGQGHYAQHHIETKTDVWLGGTLHSKIHGRLL